MSSTDTIFALASAAGRAGVSVIRLSGRSAFEIAEAFAGSISSPRKTFLRDICNPATGELIDTGLVIGFEKGASFTGEPVVEFQVHGSTSVVDTLLALLGTFKDCRLAEPGEFTRRALMNGRMDLVQVEGLADLIDAETDEQRRQANRTLSGELNEKSDDWRNKLLKINSLIEASIDFSDEELPESLLFNLSSEIESLARIFALEIDGSKAKEIIRVGFVVAIVGKPNVGKSTLLNALAGREVAIASEIAGTTRDVIEVRLDLAGIPVVLLDTAGMRESSDEIEVLGIERARQRAEDADLRIVLIEESNDLVDLGIESRADDILAFSKADISSSEGELNISAKTGLGIDTLISRVEGILRQRVSSSSSLVRQRHIDSLRSAMEALVAANGLIGQEDYDIELVSERIRESIHHIDHLVGKFNVEAVLGEIFSSFCIGK